MFKYFSLNAVCLLGFCFSQGIDFTNSAVKTNFYGYSIPRKKIDKIFNHRTIYRHLKINVKIPRAVLGHLFSDIKIAAQKANQYAKQKFEVELTNNRYARDKLCYFGFDGFSTTAYIYPLFQGKNHSRYIYYCHGEYSEGIVLRGNFMLDIRILNHSKPNLPESLLFIDAYFQLDNPFLSDFAHAFRNFGKINQWLKSIIDGTIKYIVRVGKRTAYSYYYETLAKK